jgi:arylsulfatase A-like enzyme
MRLSRRHFFFGSLAVPLLAARKPGPQPPNILLIIADRLPSWMLGAYGNQEVKTPNLDRLAQMGTRFINHIVCTPAPEPSRATIRTGRTPMQLGGAATVGANDVTLDQVLGGAGYACHVTAPAAAGGVTAEALSFLDGQAAGKQFLVTVAYSDLHPPYDGIPEKYLALYAGQNFANYSVEPAAANAGAGKEMLANRVANLRKVAAGISQLDDNVAALLARLRQKQVSDQTLVVFTGSCGALLGRRGLWAAGDASDPVNMFEESVNTPLFWSWPGRVPAVATQVEQVSTYDLLPTLCDAATIDIPKRNLCGASYLLLATGKPLPKKQRRRATVFGQYQNTGMARTGRYKLVLRDEGKGLNELYDLAADPGERFNQADNPQFVSVKTTLSGELAQWKRQYSG